MARGYNLPPEEVIRRALRYAIEWNAELVAAGNKDEVTMLELEDFRAMLKRRYGNDATPSEEFQRAFKDAPTVPLTELARRGDK